MKELSNLLLRCQLCGISTGRSLSRSSFAGPRSEEAAMAILILLTQYNNQVL